MEKLFKLKGNGTSFRTEIIAGITTFMTMCYIIALNPNILTGYGANGGPELWNAVFMATCISSAVAMTCMALTLFAFNFATLAKVGWFTVITLLVTFCMIDMFDTLGAFIGTAQSAGMLDENGKMPKLKQALASDAVGTIAGACTGTSTVTVFIEHALVGYGHLDLQNLFLLL